MHAYAMAPSKVLAWARSMVARSVRRGDSAMARVLRIGVGMRSECHYAVGIGWLRQWMTMRCHVPSARFAHIDKRLSDFY